MEDSRVGSGSDLGISSGGVYGVDQSFIESLIGTLTSFMEQRRGQVLVVKGPQKY